MWRPQSSQVRQPWAEGYNPFGVAVPRLSSSTFTAYLQMIVLGLKGMQIEEHAQEVMAYCAQLQKDFDRFKEDFDLVGTHLGRAQTKFVDADKRLDKFETKLDQAADSRELDAAGDVVAELPRAADAA